ncbi:PEP-CTERM putative exosortase interaction domain-containing protein [Methylophilaceae bacterium 11]|nr:PEP-CTERM putative exosortase interaction domain-containing protein [Methylophilaceae bacterium 11]
MKKLSIAFILLFAATSANAVVISGWSAGAKTVTTLASVATTIWAPAPPPPPANIIAPVVAKIETVIPEQHFVIFTEETKQLINEIVNCVDVPNEGGHDNVSAVPVPASLPLMATALGIFGITRRRKAFK